jgi:CMP/dCMP kinase
MRTRTCAQRRHEQQSACAGSTHTSGTDVKSSDIITIDGPVGSGKSTIGRMLAARTGFMYLDTGAMYRAVALESRRLDVAADDEHRLGRLCAQVDIAFQAGASGQRVIVNGEDVSEVIRTPDISMLASRISACGAVRRELVSMQRKAGARGGIVVDGRDAGTVIFPLAQYKYFLEAAVDVRARRRYKELLEKNMQVEYTTVFQDIVRRDSCDSGRALAPLKPADDAVIIDTSEMSIEDVLLHILRDIEVRASSLS